MIVSKNALRICFPQIDDYINDIEEAFFKSGIEVERIENIIAPDQLFYGEITSCESIEGSEKLKLCKVYIESHDITKSIVCGAKNARKGIKVVVALEGSILLNGKITIQEREIFGHKSEGMICSYAELYKSDLLHNSKDSVDGIIELGDNFCINKSYYPEDLGLDDIIFDLSFPTNRKDFYAIVSLSAELKKNLHFNSPSREKKDLGIPEDLKEKYEKNFWDIKKILLTNNFDLLSNGNSELILECLAYLLLNEAFNVSKNKLWKPNNVESYDKGSFSQKILKGMYFLIMHGDKIDNDDDKKRKKIDIDWNEIECLFNKKNQIKSTLIERLQHAGFTFPNIESNNFVLEAKSTITIPHRRQDIKRQVDIYNEIITYFDLKEINSQKIDVFKTVKPNNKIFKLCFFVSDFLIANNFLECNTYNIQDKLKIDETDILKKESSIFIDNTNNKSLRNHAINELISVFEKNINKKNKLKSVFELTTIAREEKKDYLVLNIVLPVSNESFSFNNQKNNLDIYDMMGLLKKMFFLIGCEISFETNTNAPEIFNNDLTVEIIKGESKIGYIGYLSTKLEIDLIGCVVDLEDIEITKNKIIIPSEASKYPPSFKDISICTDKDSDIEVQEIINLILKVDECCDCEIIERYEEEQKNNYLLRVKFQKNDSSLSTQEIKNLLDETILNLKEIGIIIR